MPAILKDQDNDFYDNKTTKRDSITIEKEIKLQMIKKYVNERLENGSIFRFNQTLENYLKNPVDTVKNHRKNTREQNTDTTVINYVISDGYLLQQGILKGNDEKYAGKVTTFLGATKSNSPTAKSEATDLLPVVDSFMYIETSGIN